MLQVYKILGFLLYLGIVVVCYVCVKEFAHNLLIVSAKKKAVVYHDETKFSIITIVYMIGLYVQAFIGLLPLLADLLHFIFYTWFYHVAYYYLTSIGLFWLGIINLVNVEFLYVKGEIRKANKIWITLKIGMLPFYLLNGIHYLYAIEIPDKVDWFYVVLSIFFLYGMVPVMLFIFPCALNFLNGCIGWNYIRYLRGRGEDKKRPSWIHYVLQSLPVLDLFSMAVILKKYKVSPEISEKVIAEGISPEESAAKQEERKKKDAKIFFLVILLSIVIYFVLQFTNAIFSESKVYAEPTVYEMTEEEKRLLKKLYTDTIRREKIEAGELFGTQAKELEIIRFAFKSVEEKYPETQFSIHNIRDKGDCYEFNIKEESSGGFFEMSVYDGKELTEKDNLYAYFLKEKWDPYLAEELQKKIDGIVKVECYHWKAEDAEKYMDMPAETILEKAFETVPGNVDISISAKGKSEEECRERQEMMEEIIGELQIPAFCWVRFFDETEEEMLSEGREKKEICSFSIWLKDIY